MLGFPCVEYKGNPIVKQGETWENCKITDFLARAERSTQFRCYFNHQGMLIDIWDDYKIIFATLRVFSLSGTFFSEVL